jgi:hypothetical protein
MPTLGDHRLRENAPEGLDRRDRLGAEHGGRGEDEILGLLDGQTLAHAAYGTR